MAKKVTIQVKQGSLCGKRNISILSKKPYLSFYSIPYAEPPFGKLRFQPPRPLNNWVGVYNATCEKNACVQKIPGVSMIIGSEDCLYLNVHTPKISFPINVLRPVMVFLHGGSFLLGSGSEKSYAADFLVDYDVILVTINYRLHVLGFLNLGIPECPGNIGLKDQNLAMRWVKDNIASFGGDPNNITLFGESAGSTSVHCHIISPLSQGLFHKAILQSGTILCSWSLIKDPVEVAFDIGRKLGYYGHDRLELVNFLRLQQAKDLIKAADKVRDERQDSRDRTSTIFGPSVEVIKEGAILPEHPKYLLQFAPTIPIICGCNNLEGLVAVGMLSDEQLQRVCDDVSISIKKYFHVEPNNLPYVISQIKQHYLIGNKCRKKTLESLVNLWTDILFYNFEESIEHMGKSYFPPYIYEFDYDGNMNEIKKMFSLKTKCSFQGACHGDDVHYLFYHKRMFGHKKFSDSDLKVIGNMCSMWTNFAKFGNPSVDIWRPYTAQEPCYLKINTDLKLVHGTVYGERRQFLKNLLRPYEMKAFSNI